MPLIADESLSEADFKRVSDLVYAHCGINLHDGKKELVRARLAKHLRSGNFDSVSDYLAHVEADATGAEFSKLIDSISTNLTSFFREHQHFDHLNETFLPALLKKRKAEGKFRLRAWSAGCSTGEEPYSLAITLCEMLQGEGAWDAKLLATDISTRVLAHAKAGVYEKARVEGMNPAYKNRYFTALPTDKTKVSAVSQLKDMISFRHLNLMEPWPFSGPFDFIFCRNVMIYFDKPTQEKLVNRYYDVLESGGLLFTGHSESLTGIKHRFKYVKPTIYQKP